MNKIQWEQWIDYLMFLELNGWKLAEGTWEKASELNPDYDSDSPIAKAYNKYFKSPKREER